MAEPALQKRTIPAGNLSASKTRLQMIAGCGHFFQVLGLPRSTGQIFGALYLSVKPLSLDDLVRTLSISKGSASMGTRFLMNWGAIRQVWVPGERRDYFEAVGDLGGLLRNAYNEFLKPRMKSSQMRLGTMLHDLDDDLKAGHLTPEEHKLCAERLKHLTRTQKKMAAVIPLAEKFLFR
ncbi:MAG: hypothetical protein SFY81_05890 [Verrucomicrobiota bacterium]|nr:hypothetical protein [Verrucomicrobiota bacterium]